MSRESQTRKISQQADKWLSETDDRFSFQHQRIYFQWLGGRLWSHIWDCLNNVYNMHIQYTPIDLFHGKWVIILCCKYHCFQHCCCCLLIHSCKWKRNQISLISATNRYRKTNKPNAKWSLLRWIKNYVKILVFCNMMMTFSDADSFFLPLLLVGRPFCRWSVHLFPPARERHHKTWRKKLLAVTPKIFCEKCVFKKYFCAKMYKNVGDDMFICSLGNSSPVSSEFQWHAGYLTETHCS